MQHIDTSDIYSSSAYGKLGQNEVQIGNYLKAHPEARSKLFLATKHVFTIEADGSRGVRGGRDYAHEALNASLKRLNTDHVDLFYTHRPVDAEIESSIQGMKELQQEGKLKYIGVSEYNVQQLERAEKIAHIDALQIGELSGLRRGIVLAIEVRKSAARSHSTFIADLSNPPIPPRPQSSRRRRPTSSRTGSTSGAARTERPSSPTLRSGAACCRASSTRRRWTTTTSASTTRASRPIPSRTTSRSSTTSSPSPLPTAPPMLLRGRSHWRGCWRRGRTSS